MTLLKPVLWLQMILEIELNLCDDVHEPGIICLIEAKQSGHGCTFGAVSKIILKQICLYW